MSNKNPSVPLPDVDNNGQETMDDVHSDSPPPSHNFENPRRLFKRLPPFWHDRLIEVGLILSMALYYVVGNPSFGTSYLFQSSLLALGSVVFLLIFAVICWYRLSFGIALLPLTLPFYLVQKTVFSHYAFSIAEISLAVCLAVALLQLLLSGNRTRLLSFWSELRNRLGVFIIPILIFFIAAVLSIFIAFSHVDAFRAFYEEVLSPLLYVLLALTFLRKRSDVMRLLGALFGAGLFVALLGMAQYFLFKNQLILEADGIRRVHAIYGSANSIGLFFDYVFPLALAFILTTGRKVLGKLTDEQSRLLLVVLCLPLLLVLYLSHSRGAEVAIVVAVLFIIACSIHSRKNLLIGVLIGVVLAVGGFFVFYNELLGFLDAHTSAHGVSTTTERLYLWQSALNMIHASPWFGWGMDNWLCHYSKNVVCDAHQFHYWLIKDPVTGAPTGLLNEPTLSHPHNIFLHVWVSIGIFGLLAFVALLLLFFWLFVRILRHLRSTKVQAQGGSQLEWMTIGVGAAMVAALIQGQVDSSFLEQDLAFCFWMLVAALLLLRTLSGTPWWGQTKLTHIKTEYALSR